MCAQQDLTRTINTVVDCRNRAPKQSPAIFALALLVGEGYKVGDALNKVCLTGTQLFEFVESCKHLRGWGSYLKRLVANWYLDKPAEKVAYQVTKYQQRNTWSHRDVLRLAHPAANEPLNEIFEYVCQRDKWQKREVKNEYLQAVEEVKTADLKRAIQLVQQHNLVREVIPTEFLNRKEMWEVLLDRMPMTAMIRNLGKMSQIELLTPMSKASRLVCSRLLDEELLRAAKIHPFNVLLAHVTYGQGKGLRGSLMWTVDQQILQALDDAFYKSFEFVEPTNKRYYIGLDCSGSMWSPIMGSPITACMGAGALAMTAIRTEPFTYNAGFSTHMIPINLTKSTSLKSVVKKMREVNWGRTNCSLPMADALRKKIEVDCFIEITDNETWAGSQHPFQTLKEYRNKMGIDAKLVVIGMTSTGFTIADPNDKGMLDVVGFDSSAPSVIADFCRGN